VARKDFHEIYGGGEVKLPSERSTGLVFAGVALIVAALWRKDPLVPWVAFGVAIVLAAISFGAPKLLKPLNILWFRFGLLLHRIVNPVVMLVMFVVVFVPAGLIMRIWHDPLRSRRAPAGSSYWVQRAPSAERPGSMTNQF
jgi:hypothetical protein